MILEQLYLLAPEMLLILMSFVILLVGVFRDAGKPLKNVGIASFLAMIMAIFLLYSTGSQSLVYSTVTDNVFGGLNYNKFTIYAKNLILVSAILSIAVGHEWFVDKNNIKFEYHSLFLISVVGLMLMISANNLLFLYVAFELASLPLYVLVSLDKKSSMSSEAGIKYFTLGAVSSGLFLFGASLVYGFSGSLDFNMINNQISISDSIGGISQGLIIGMVMIVIAILFKIAAAPFHMWSPDVYQGSPTPITIFLSSTPKISFFLLLLLMLAKPFALLQQYWQPILIITSVLSMLIGAVAAIAQNNLKRMLAYSSIGHVGFALIAIISFSQEAFAAAIIYISIYTFMAIGSFSCLLMMRSEDNYYENISDLSGLSKRHPVFAICLTIFMLSMIGIPPLAGFFGKLYIIMAAINSNMIPLAIIGVVYSIVASFYYLRIIKIMYFDNEKIRFSPPAEILVYILLICVIINLIFFTFTSSLIEIINSAVKMI